MVTRARFTGLALGAALICACAAEPATRPRTELLLVADTDIAELTRIDFEVSGDGHGAERHSAAVRDDGAALTVGLVRDKGPLGPLTATARGFAGSRELVSRAAVVSFVAGRTLVVPLHLLRRCLEVACGAGESCGEQGCAPSPLPTESLAEWPSLPPDIRVSASPHDAGPEEDGGLDASIDPDAHDAGAADAGDDAGPELDAALADAGDDATVTDDAGMDARVEPPGDAASDAASDAQADGAAGSDAAADASADGGACSPDLTRDPNHCGSCTNVCLPSYVFPFHDMPACKAGQCTWACAAPYAECNNLLILDFCETNLNTDANNCGGCGVKCKGNETCQTGACKPKPP